MRRVIEEGEGALGEAVGAHEHGREPHVGPPRVHHLLHREPLQPYQRQVHEPLHEREVPAVAVGTRQKQFRFQKRVAASDQLHFFQVVRMEASGRQACIVASAVTRSPELKPVVHVLLEQDKSRN